MTEIVLEDVVVEYERDGYRTRPIDGLSRQLHDGRLVLLLGPSGCGKTTLLSCLGGLLRPQSGRILVGGRDLVTMTDDQLRDHRRDRAGFIFQSFNLIPSLNARDNVAAPLISQGASRREARRRAERVLAEVGMADHLRSRPGQLSGGQQQRVAVARGLVHGPQLLLADEPTANLDYVQTEAVISLLRGLAKPGRIVIVSTHDDRLLPIADEVVNLVAAEDLSSTTVGPVALEAGEALFQQGERGSLVYMIDSGEIEIVRSVYGREEVLARLGPGQYFGELGPMMGQPRSATARARSTAVVVSMTLQDFRVRSRHDVHDALHRARPPAAKPTRTTRRRREPLRAEPR